MRRRFHAVDRRGQLVGGARHVAFVAMTDQFAEVAFVTGKGVAQRRQIGRGVSRRARRAFWLIGAALAGVAAETGVIMLIYLDHAWEAIKTKCRVAGREPGVADLYEAVMEGAVERVRPKMMTVVAIMAGLLPIMWGTGTGSEVMSRIAAPMVGGMISSTILTLAVIPAIYALVKQWRLGRGMEP